MQRLREKLRPYQGDRAFYQGALSVMVPVMIQQLINNLFNMVDTLMVGSLDVQGLAMSAVSVANKPIILYNGFLFGLAGAGGLLISQYFGARNRKACQGLFWLELTLAFLCAVGFFIVLFCFPEPIMRLFVTDPHTVMLGVSYLRIVSFSYLPAAISSVCMFALRSLGQNRDSMFISLGSMGVNTVVNSLLIFGLLGFPRLGVAGAAYGTLIARLFEMSVYLYRMFCGRMYFRFEPGALIRLGQSLRRKFAVKAIPLVVNELLYGLGLNLIFWSYARLDEAALPALTIAELCFQIAAVIITGCSSAVSVLIGASLGAGELDKARDHARKLFGLTLWIGLMSMVLCLALAFLMPLLYPIEEALRREATQISCVLAVFAPVNFLYAFCFFCLRAGGDTRNAMLLDSGFMWVLPVPAGVLMALLLPGRMPMLIAVLIVQILNNLKIIQAIAIVKKGKWVRNITLEDGA